MVLLMRRYARRLLWWLGIFLESRPRGIVQLEEWGCNISLAQFWRQTGNRARGSGAWASSGARARGEPACGREGRATKGARRDQWCERWIDRVVLLDQRDRCCIGFALVKNVGSPKSLLRRWVPKERRETVRIWSCCQKIG